MFKRLRNMTVVMTFLLVYAICFKYSERADVRLTSGSAKEKFVIAIDAGHGGRDPGVVSKKGDIEKDINLSIATKLKRLMEAEGARVVMVRENDDALYGENDSNKKVADMRNRASLVNESDAELFVSIHVNSYVDESVCGSQTFYLKGNEDGAKLATCIQKNMNKLNSEKKEKAAKANNSYYLLKNILVPSVIVECGFLSNPVELELLKDEGYQENVAFAIHMGIMEYIN